MDDLNQDDLNECPNNDQSASNDDDSFNNYYNLHNQSLNSNYQMNQTNYAEEIEDRDKTLQDENDNNYYDHPQLDFGNNHSDNQMINQSVVQQNTNFHHQEQFVRVEDETSTKEMVVQNILKRRNPYDKSNDHYITSHTKKLNVGFMESNNKTNQGDNQPSILQYPQTQQVYHKQLLIGQSRSQENSLQNTNQNYNNTQPKHQVFNTNIVYNNKITTNSNNSPYFLQDDQLQQVSHKQLLIEQSRYQENSLQNTNQNYNNTQPKHQVFNTNIVYNNNITTNSNNSPYCFQEGQNPQVCHEQQSIGFIRKQESRQQKDCKVYNKSQKEELFFNQNLFNNQNTTTTFHNSPPFLQCSQLDQGSHGQQFIGISHYQEQSQYNSNQNDINANQIPNTFNQHLTRSSNNQLNDNIDQGLKNQPNDKLSNQEPEEEEQNNNESQIQSEMSCFPECDSELNQSSFCYKLASFNKYQNDHLNQSGSNDQPQREDQSQNSRSQQYQHNIEMNDVQSECNSKQNNFFNNINQQPNTQSENDSIQNIEEGEEYIPQMEFIFKEKSLDLKQPNSLIRSISSLDNGESLQRNVNIITQDILTHPNYPFHYQQGLVDEFSLFSLSDENDELEKRILKRILILKCCTKNERQCENYKYVLKELNKLQNKKQKQIDDHLEQQSFQIKNFYQNLQNHILKYFNKRSQIGEEKLNFRHFLYLFPHLAIRLEGEEVKDVITVLESTSQGDPILQMLKDLRNEALRVFSGRLYYLTRIFKSSKKFKNIDEFYYGCLYYAERETQEQFSSPIHPLEPIFTPIQSSLMEKFSHENINNQKFI